MSDVLTRITACHDKNTGIISRIEALRGVRPFTYSIELSAADIDDSKHDLLEAKVHEFQYENVATLLEDWSFPGTLRTDFAPFIRRALTWNAPTWDEIKTLNGDMKDFASSLGDSCKRAHGALPEIIEGELRKLLENFERIEAALSAFEKDIAGGRLRPLQREVSQKAREFSNFIVQKGFRLPPPVFRDSSILPAAASRQHQKLSSWYPGGWTLIYKGSRDGLNAASFHARVDGKGPTLTIIQSGENIFGGYAAVPWKETGGYVDDNAASLFLLKSAQGVEPEQFFLVDQEYGKCALYHDSTYGPTFGKGHDLTCFPNGGQSCSELDITYALNLIPGTGDVSGALTLADDNFFNPSEIEVFEQTRADRGRGQTPASSGSRWTARSRSARREA